MIASRVLMVCPLTFCSNVETQGSNHFQKSAGGSNSEVAVKARAEFAAFQTVLTDHGIEILTFDEDASAQTPDALFPNNWFWQLPNGKVFVSAMYAPNRRREYRPDIIKRLGGEVVQDFRPNAEKELFLEGTGSIVFDHTHRLAYACLSPRTSASLVEEFAEIAGYRAVLFTSVDASGQEIYHTNVMMAMGERNVVINLASIPKSDERAKLLSTFASTGKSVVDISHEQMSQFAGNMLSLKNKAGEKFWACSTRAVESLTAKQREQLRAEAKILHAPLTTIEDYGGGGARCLMAELWNTL